MPDLLAYRDVDVVVGVDADHGDQAGERLVLVHGFTQTARCWAPFDELLAAHHPLRLVDAPGHGASGHATADIVEAARLLGETGSTAPPAPTTAGATAARAATYLGYSMGGRIALRLALDRPDLVYRLVLIGASPGVDAPEERAARRTSDERLADRIEVIGAPAFLDEWLAQPLFAGLAPERAHRAERERNTAAGLAASLRHLGTGAQAPLWSRLADLTAGVLLVAGERDEKFTAIARRMAAAIGAPATVAVIPGAGHTAHLEQPERTAAVVLDWLAAERASPAG